MWYSVYEGWDRERFHPIKIWLLGIYRKDKKRFMEGEEICVTLEGEGEKTSQRSCPVVSQLILRRFVGI